MVVGCTVGVGVGVTVGNAVGAGVGVEVGNGVGVGAGVAVGNNVGIGETVGCAGVAVGVSSGVMAGVVVAGTSGGPGVVSLEHFVMINMASMITTSTPRPMPPKRNRFFGSFRSGAAGVTS